MNLDGAAARALVVGIVAAMGGLPRCRIGLFPPFTLLREVVAWTAGSPQIVVGAQDCHPESAGAYTGEVSAAQVRDCGATAVIIGHSERRRYFGEREPLIHKKLKASLEAGLDPIYCIGEQLEERDAGRTLDVVNAQLDGALAGLGPDALRRITVAYEPVWAIGTGRNATPAQAVEVHRAIRVKLAALGSPNLADAMRIQYGGSVTADNAAALLAEAEIDGALVGGASLKLDSFLAIARAARA